MALELRAREILESGDVLQFERFVASHADRIQVQYLFNKRLSFPVLLVQTYRKAEYLAANRSDETVIENYKRCLGVLVDLGCDLNVQDAMMRTVGHWSILLHCVQFLAAVLELGCNSLLQNSEGETIVHLAVRHNNLEALDLIKLHCKDKRVLETPSETSGATPFIYAVQIGADDAVRKLVQLAVNLDGQEDNECKRTALHYCVVTENEAMFGLLLRNGARPDIRDHQGRSVLDLLSERPPDGFVRLVAQHCGADMLRAMKRRSSAQPCPPIIAACKNADYQLLCTLTRGENGDSAVQAAVTAEDGESRTALHHCAGHRDIRCAERLIELAPDLIGKKDKCGLTALHLATIANNAVLVRTLLEHGADPRDSDGDGHSSLHWAVVYFGLDLIERFLTAEPRVWACADSHGASALHYAVQAFLTPEGSTQGPVVIRRLLRDHQGDIDCLDHYHRSPLLWAANLGLTDCCRLLLDNGANITLTDNNGLSALHYAASHGHYDVIDLLVNCWSASVDAEDHNKCTPLFYAVTLRHLPIIEFLVAHKSSLDHQDSKGRSVAHCAAMMGYGDVLELLRKEGASLTLSNHSGDLPLHEAVRTGNIEVCQLLLDKMEESGEISLVNSANRAGYSPLHKAAKSNSATICRLLIERGADVNLLTTKSKKSPLDLASEPETIDLLRSLNAVGAKERRETRTVSQKKPAKFREASDLGKGNGPQSPDKRKGPKLNQSTKSGSSDKEGSRKSADLHGDGRANIADSSCQSVPPPENRGSAPPDELNDASSRNADRLAETRRNPLKSYENFIQKPITKMRDRRAFHEKVSERSGIPGNVSHVAGIPGNGSHVVGAPGNGNHVAGPPGNGSHVAGPPGNGSHVADSGAENSVVVSGYGQPQGPQKQANSVSVSNGRGDPHNSVEPIGQEAARPARRDSNEDGNRVSKARHPRAAPPSLNSAGKRSSADWRGSKSDGASMSSGTRTSKAANADATSRTSSDKMQGNTDKSRPDGVPRNKQVRSPRPGKLKSATMATATSRNPKPKSGMELIENGVEVVKTTCGTSSITDINCTTTSGSAGNQSGSAGSQSGSAMGCGSAGKQSGSAGNQSSSAMGSGSAGSQSSSAGKQSDSAGNQSGNAGSQSGSAPGSGSAGNQSGNAGNQSGNAGSQSGSAMGSGNAGNQSGSAGNQSGNAGNQSGSAPGSGNTGNKRRNPSQSSRLHTKVKDSVKEFKDIRERTKSIMDQRRMDMFQGYGREADLRKMPTRTRPARPERSSDRKPDNMALRELQELQEMPGFDGSVQIPQAASRRPIPAQSKEQQIRSAYSCEPSISPLLLN